MIALALDADGNMPRDDLERAHCLATGIIDDERAPRCAKRLLPTTCTRDGESHALGKEPRYNPMSYTTARCAARQCDGGARARARRRLRGRRQSRRRLFDAWRTTQHLESAGTVCGFRREVGLGPFHIRSRAIASVVGGERVSCCCRRCSGCACIGIRAAVVFDTQPVRRGWSGSASDGLQVGGRRLVRAAAVPSTAPRSK